MLSGVLEVEDDDVGRVFDMDWRDFGRFAA